MEQSQINPELQDFTQPARPSFLNTLCILSFIMSGIMIVFGIWGVISSYLPYTAEELESIDKMRQMGIDDKMLQKDPMGQIVSLLFQFISLIGIILMWKLKKPGFYIYTAGELAPYIYTLIAGKAVTDMIGALGSMFATIAYILFALVVIIDIVFIILYAVNLKYMK